MLSKSEFKKLPLIITSMSRWDGDTSSASLSLAKVFGRTNRVFYLDFPYSIADLWRGRKQPDVQKRLPALLYGRQYLNQIADDSPYLTNVTSRFVLPFFNLPPGIAWRTASRYNNKKVARLIKNLLRQEGIEDYLFLNSFNPSYFSTINRYFNPELSIYQSRDAIEPIHALSIAREDECVRNYDVSVATSKHLCKNIQNRTGASISYLPNGGDTRLFQTAITQSLSKPTELRNIRTPIIGYTGAVCQRIDYELLVRLATANPEKTIVMVGPRRDKQFTSINLDSIPNLVFTGAKRLDELPAFLKFFDCAIIPFKCDQLTASIYPLKLNEYLAAGKSVVTTNFSEDITGFQSQVYLAHNYDEFLEHVKCAICDNTKEKQTSRLTVAENNSWEHRAEAFWELAWEAYRQKHADAKPYL